jgi:hypothetical protein
MLFFLSRALQCRVFFQMGEGYAAIQKGGGLPGNGGWGQSDYS